MKDKNGNTHYGKDYGKKDSTGGPCTPCGHRLKDIGDIYKVIPKEDCLKDGYRFDAVILAVKEAQRDAINVLAALIKQEQLKGTVHIYQSGCSACRTGDCSVHIGRPVGHALESLIDSCKERILDQTNRVYLGKNA